MHRLSRTFLSAVIGLLFVTGVSDVRAQNPDALYLTLLKSYDRMPPDKVFDIYYNKLSQTHRQILNAFSALGANMHLRMCAGRNARRINFQGLNCPTLIAQDRQWQLLRKQWLRQGLENLAKPEYISQRRQLIVTQECAVGVIDKASCGAYASAQRNINRITNNTSRQIIRNMAPKCTNYYDFYGRYRGCR